jgi:hypothetical protein
MKQLRDAKSAEENNVTIHDSLIAYVILTLNTFCYFNNDERRILRTNTAVHFRGISDSIAPQGLITNSVFMMLSDSFDDPYSLGSIAQTIRRSINKSCASKFLEPWLATADGLLRKTVNNNQLLDMGLFPNEAMINSNFRYDWANLVDFGYTDKCRFYTTWTGALYLRVFHLNPEKNGNDWLIRDKAEVSFRMEKGLNVKFLNVMKNDITENFENVKNVR